MLTILKPGLMTTIQDLGRFGYQRYGVITSGSMDPVAHRLANLLVGNDENLPTLEMTMIGPHVRFEQNAVIALCGGDLSPRIDGEAVKLWTPIRIKKGEVLSAQSAKTGCRMYLAIQGGIKIPEVMGSTSTYLRAGFGGYKGRMLRSGDQIEFLYHDNSENNDFYDYKQKEWMVSTDFYHKALSNYRIRVMKGRQYELFNQRSQNAFFQEEFIVSNQSDRMGFRLTGPTLELEEAKETISEAVTYGSIQVPANGSPIILLADRQTIGGYPKIAQIASVDYSVIAQRKPGESITFEEISHKDAQRLLLEQEEKIQIAKQGIQLKFQ